jgi:hypothetical protein
MRHASILQQATVFLNDQDAHGFALQDLIDPDETEIFSWKLPLEILICDIPPFVYRYVITFKNPANVNHSQPLSGG